MTDIVQRRGRSPTAGELQNTLCGRSSDRRPCEDNGQPQTNIRYCDEPAHESLITDVSRRRSHPCTIIAPSSSHAHQARTKILRSTLDEGHKSVLRRFTPVGAIRPSAYCALRCKRREYLLERLELVAGGGRRHDDRRAPARRDPGLGAVAHARRRA